MPPASDQRGKGLFVVFPLYDYAELSQKKLAVSTVPANFAAWGRGRKQ
jgi:hypothetical protein